MVLLLAGVASAAPWVGQVRADCDRSCMGEVDTWLAAQSGRALLPAAAGRADPARFAELGLDRLVVVPEPGVPPAGLLWLTPDQQGAQLALPDDPQLGLQWGLVNDGSEPGSVAGADIGAEAAWDITTGGVLVAVLDSGVSLEQPDLALWTNAGEVADNGLDDDGNGYVDDVHGWDFAARDPDPTDITGHGTNVASIAAATGDNGTSLAGVCWGCEVMAVRNLDDFGSGWYSWWTESLIYAVDNGAQVVNMSEGGYGYDKALELAVAYAVGAGVPVVVANGNDASDQWPNFPAYLPDAIAVGATRSDDGRAATFDWGGGSSYGDHLDLVAPGTFIYGLSPRATQPPSYWSGSSQATPFVAGAAALLLSLEPGLTAVEVRTYLEGAAADQVGLPSEDIAGWDRHHGHGRLDAGASLLWLQEDIADADGDGVDLRSGDCDDEDPAAAPGLPELCDGIDNDCDGVTGDEELDSDGDGSRACDDCDDDDPARAPGLVDVPDDGIDQDCDGQDAVSPPTTGPTTTPDPPDGPAPLSSDLSAETQGGCGCQTTGPVGIELLMAMLLLLRARGSSGRGRSGRASRRTERL